MSLLYWGAVALAGAGGSLLLAQPVAGIALVIAGVLIVIHEIKVKRS